MAPGPGLLRATKEGGKSRTQLRWVSQARGVGGASEAPVGGAEVPFEGQAAVLRSLFKCRG